MSDEENTQRAIPFLSPMQQFGASILQLTNPENEIYKMELTLRSQILDKDGNPKSVGYPLMNDEGISSVIGQVQGLSNQITIMSNFKEDEIKKVLLDTMETLIQDLMINSVTYNIVDKAARDKIVTNFRNTCFVTMNRSLNNGERGFWKGSQQDIRQTIETGNQSKGIFGMLGWGKK